jgi:hypothetical protein
MIILQPRDVMIDLALRRAALEGWGSPVHMTDFPEGNGKTPEQNRDQLEYMADLIVELCAMAHSQRLTTLAGLLELAHAEARLRVRDLS